MRRKSRLGSLKFATPISWKTHKVWYSRIKLHLNSFMFLTGLFLIQRCKIFTKILKDNFIKNSYFFLRSKFSWGFRLLSVLKSLLSFYKSPLTLSFSFKDIENKSTPEKREKCEETFFPFWFFFVRQWTFFCSVLWDCISHRKIFSWIGMFDSFVENFLTRPLSVSGW